MTSDASTDEPENIGNVLMRTYSRPTAANDSQVLAPEKAVTIYGKTGLLKKRRALRQKPPD